MLGSLAWRDRRGMRRRRLRRRLRLPRRGGSIRQHRQLQHDPRSHRHRWTMRWTRTRSRPRSSVSALSSRSTRAWCGLALTSRLLVSRADCPVCLCPPTTAVVTPCGHLSTFSHSRREGRCSGTDTAHSRDLRPVCFACLQKSLARFPSSTLASSTHYCTDCLICIALHRPPTSSVRNNVRQQRWSTRPARP